MDDTVNKRDSNCDDLEEALKILEEEAFGGNVPEDMDKVRRDLLETLKLANAPRLQKGLVLGRYKASLTTDAMWTRARQTIARRYTGYSSRNSVHTLIENAQHAVKLPQPMLDAMMEAGLDPATTVNRSLVDEVLALQFAGGANEAREQFSPVHQAWRANKKKKAAETKAAKAKAAKGAAGRMVTLAFESVKHLPKGKRPEALIEMLREVLTRISSAIAPYTANLDVTTSAAQPANPEPDPGTGSGQANLPVRKVAVISAITRTKPCTEQTAELDRSVAEAPASALAHPLGDICLSSLRGDGAYGMQMIQAGYDALLFPPEDGDATLEFDANNLYRVLDDQVPKRIFISDWPDLCDPRVPLEVILEHLRVMEAARWHTFQWLTSIHSRFGQIQSAWLPQSLRHRWPSNLSLGSRIVSPYHVPEELEVFKAYRAEHKFLALLPFRSDDNSPLSKHGEPLRQLIREARLPWLLFGGSIDPRNGRSSLSSADATFIVQAFTEAGTKICYTTIDGRSAFEQDGRPKPVGPDEHSAAKSSRSFLTRLEQFKEIPAYKQHPVCDVSGFERRYSAVTILGPKGAAA